MGIAGVGGTVVPLGIGTIRLSIKDSEGEDHIIELSNVIYLPDCPKNLILITRWSTDKGDNCGIFSRGKYSIFLWNHDKFKCLVDHPADCPIPLLSVNEGETDRFEAYLSGGPSSYQMSEFIDTPTGLEVPLNVAQQPTGNGLLIPPGSTVRYANDNKTKICSVLENNINHNGASCSTLRVLNSKEEVLVPTSDFVSANAPEPSNVSDHPSSKDLDDFKEALDEANSEFC